MSERKLRIGVAGCGRMGRRHAFNVAFLTPRAELVAVADEKLVCLQDAKASLLPSVQYFSSGIEMIAKGDIEAILIATESSTHPALICAALEANKHVLTEKPISIDMQDTYMVAEAAEKHPELVVMVGFSRRYDPSYLDVKQKIEDGLLGRPYYVRSATNDMYDPSGFFVAYSQASGGIFMDMGIHDIDMSRWLLDVKNLADSSTPQKQVSRVYATGTNIHHPELAKSGDCDNGYGIIEYANGTKCTLHLSRTALNGHDAPCEVFGSKAKVTVNWGSNQTRNEIRDAHGVRTESHQNYYDRFREGFVQEANAFVACVLDKAPVTTTVADAVAAAEIAEALTYSFRYGKVVLFGENGRAIMGTEP